MAPQHVEIAETIAALRRKLKREQEGFRGSATDDATPSATNRGNKLKQSARYAHAGSLPYKYGPSGYKEKIDHAGFSRYILDRNPKRFNELGDELDDSESDAEADADAEDENPYGEIRLEEILRPLTHPSELATHPTLSVPYLDQALPDMVHGTEEKLREARANLWRAKNLYRHFIGDESWIPCEEIEHAGDWDLFEPLPHDNTLHAPAARSPQKKRKRGQVVPGTLDGVEQQDHATNGLTAQDSASDRGTNGNVNGMSQVDGTQNRHDQDRPTEPVNDVDAMDTDERPPTRGVQVKQEGTEATNTEPSGVAPGHGTAAGEHASGVEAEARQNGDGFRNDVGTTARLNAAEQIEDDVGTTARLNAAEQIEDDVGTPRTERSPSRPPSKPHSLPEAHASNNANVHASADVGAGVRPQAGGKTETTPQPPRRITRALAAEAHNTTSNADSHDSHDSAYRTPPLSPSSSTVSATTSSAAALALSLQPHPLFLFPPSFHVSHASHPASALPLKVAHSGLPVDEVLETRRLLGMYVQKQEESIRGLENVLAKLYKAKHRREVVWTWCTAEAHVGEWSDGEDWIDGEAWGLREGELRKGKDEEEAPEEEPAAGAGGRKGKRRRAREN